MNKKYKKNNGVTLPKTPRFFDSSRSFERKNQ